MIRFYLHVLAIAGSISLLLHAGAAHATPNSDNGFFNKDGALSPFGPRLESQPAVPIVMLPTPSPKPEEAKQEIIGVLQKAAATAAATAAPLSGKEELIAKYGAPDSEPPVEAHKDAPAPFKAVMDALAIGDDDLAYAYAKRYIRYRERQKQAVDKAMAFQQLALEQEGQIDEEQNGPEVDLYRPLMERNRALEEARKQENQQANPETVEPQPVRHEESAHDLFARAEKIVAQAEAEKERNGGAKPAKRITPPPVDPAEAAQRAQLRAALAGKLQPDPQGKVEIYFFCKPHDKLALQMAHEVDKVYQLHRESGKLLLSAFTMDSSGNFGASGFKKRAGVSFPVTAGLPFAQKLGITESPTLVIRTPGNNQSFHVTGLKEAYYVDEVVKVLRGVE